MKQNIIYHYLKVKLLLGALFLCLNLWAQVEAPDLYCVVGDTVRWSPMPTTCSGLEGFNIYSASDLNGPYSLLASILDPTETDFVHAAPGIHYYYIESIASCPGQNALQSDTLTNAQLPQVDIDFVSVLNNQDILISWNPSTHPNINEYVIFNNTNMGSMPLGNTSDTFMIVSGYDLDLPHKFTVYGIDRCGKNGAFSSIHSTSVISFNIDFCSSEVIIDHLPYTSWASDGYDIDIISLDHLGTGTDLAIFRFDQSDSLKLTQLLNNQDYCLKLRFVNRTSLATSETNTVCFRTSFSKIDLFYATNISYVECDSLQIDWVWDNIAFNQIELRNDQEDLISIINQSGPLRTENEFRFNAGTPESLYNILVKDPCDKTYITEYLRPGYLILSIDQDNLITARFTDPKLPQNSEVVNVDLIHKNGGNALIESFNIEPSSYSFDGNQFSDDSLCFYVEYRHQNDSSLLAQNNFVSISNCACVSKFPQLFFPTAFAPNGVNNVFRPQGTSFSANGYSLLVYNRYGQQVFKSDNPRQGWDGYYNGRVMPAGGYLYLMRIERGNQNSIEKRGIVQLVD